VPSPAPSCCVAKVAQGNVERSPPPLPRGRFLCLLLWRSERNRRNIERNRTGKSVVEENPKMTFQRAPMRVLGMGTALTLPAHRRKMARPAAAARACAVVLIALAALLLPGAAGRESCPAQHYTKMPSQHASFSVLAVARRGAVGGGSRGRRAEGRPRPLVAPPAVTSAERTPRQMGSEPPYLTNHNRRTH
jgi:hypothetical protein